MGPERSMAPPVVDLPDAAVLNRGRHRACLRAPARPAQVHQGPPGRGHPRPVPRGTRLLPPPRRAAGPARPSWPPATAGWTPAGDAGSSSIGSSIAGGDDTSSVNLERAITGEAARRGGDRVGVAGPGGVPAGAPDPVERREPEEHLRDDAPLPLRFVIVDGLGGRTALDLKYRVLKSVPLLARLYTAWQDRPADEAGGHPAGTRLHRRSRRGRLPSTEGAPRGSPPPSQTPSRPPGNDRCRSG